MAVKESKRALAEAATLLATDTQAARAYLRGVQRLAGPIPYATIVAAMRAAGSADAHAVASLAAEMAAREEPVTELWQGISRWLPPKTGF